MINASLMMVYPRMMMAKMALLSILLACNWLPVVVAQNTTTTTQSNATSTSPIISPTTPPPTLNPITRTPSSSPTISTSPTSSPSSTPSTTPTISSEPTSKPSITSEPSSHPTSGTPTIAPNPLPTASPLFSPSAAPSWNTTNTVTGKFSQWLTVTNGKVFDDVEQSIYEEAVMEQYTDRFGEMVGKPFIVTKCKIINQALAGRRKRYHFDDAGDEEPIRRLGSRKNVNQQHQHQQQQQQQQRERQLQSSGDTLVMTFTMTYTSRYGIDVANYPELFKDYVNGNLVEVTADMKNKFLPVAEANSVLLFVDSPTLEPTVVAPPTLNPTMTVIVPTSQPSMSSSPSLPISPPSPSTKKPTGGENPNDQTSFIIGLASGLGGATLIVILLICYMRRKNERLRNTRQMSAQGGVHHDESIEVVSADGGVNRSVAVMASPSDSIFSKDTIMSNPSMVSGGGSGSFSSDSDQNDENNRLKSLQDEFDMHKNQNMELMTGGASTAMTRALMEDEDNMDKNQWGNGKRGKGGMEDPESIEANALNETYDWLRKNGKSSLDERNTFFQQILNKMVYTVRQGLNPSDGTSIIHSCAAMLGLQLEHDIPNNVLIVTGLLKTKDTTQGRQYLIEAFNEFGDIESAAIASSNKGFGFVRFVHPRSVQRALEQDHTSEIEVQDVSVMIQTLKS